MDSCSVKGTEYSIRRNATKRQLRLLGVMGFQQASSLLRATLKCMTFLTFQRMIKNITRKIQHGANAGINTVRASVL
jgi:hypothetical protein